MLIKSCSVCSGRTGESSLARAAISCVRLRQVHVQLVLSSTLARLDGAQPDMNDLARWGPQDCSNKLRLTRRAIRLRTGAEVQQR